MRTQATETRGRAVDASPADRVTVLGCEIDRLDMEATLALCEEHIRSRRFAQHIAINAAKLVAMHDSEELLDVARRCEIISADGQAVVWAARLLGDPLPCRVAGIDLMHGLLERAAERGYRVYILGAREDVLARAIERLRKRYPGLTLAGHRDGYFARDEDARVAADIAATNPDMLFVAMSSPRKEQFLGTYGRAMGIPFVMGVGGSIDIVAGITRRAPRVLQSMGLEWLFRLFQEPRRLFHRYLTTNTRFIALIGRDVLGRRRSRLP